jgi:hypothetical protein
MNGIDAKPFVMPEKKAVAKKSAGKKEAGK